MIVHDSSSKQLTFQLMHKLYLQLKNCAATVVDGSGIPMLEDDLSFMLISLNKP